MFALKNQKSLALLFCFPFQMQEVYHVEFEEYFRRILLNMNLSFGDFFSSIKLSAIHFSVLNLFALRCIRHSPFDLLLIFTRNRGFQTFLQHRNT